MSLQQSPDLSALEQEVMCHLLQVRQEVERLRAGLDRYSYLWKSNRREVMQQFLTYSRELGPELLEVEVEVEETPPTLKDFQREVRHTCPGVFLKVIQSVFLLSRCFTPPVWCIVGGDSAVDRWFFRSPAASGLCVCDVLLQMESLHRLNTEVTHLDDVIILHSWLQVDLRPFRDSLLSIIHDWTQMYTEYLLDSVGHR